MPPIVPHRFLVRMCHPVPYERHMPLADEDSLFELPMAARLSNHAALDGGVNFADVRLAWNEFGLGVQIELEGKKEPAVGNPDTPRSSDGVAIWIDTRSDRTSHRASRYCHEFHILPTSGPDDPEPWFGQMKINRALQDAPLCGPADVPFRLHTTKVGYRLEAFFPQAVLSGYDPEQHPQLGFYYAIRDQELGDQYLSVNGDFPFADDPSLWATIELKK